LIVDHRLLQARGASNTSFELIIRGWHLNYRTLTAHIVCGNSCRSFVRSWISMQDPPLLTSRNFSGDRVSLPCSGNPAASRGRTGSINKMLSLVSASSASLTLPR
jgi:hypothetical protein